MGVNFVVILGSKRIVWDDFRMVRDSWACDCMVLWYWMILYGISLIGMELNRMVWDSSCTWIIWNSIGLYGMI